MVGFRDRTPLIAAVIGTAWEVVYVGSAVATDYFLKTGAWN